MFTIGKYHTTNRQNHTRRTDSEFYDKSENVDSCNLGNFSTVFTKEGVTIRTVFWYVVMKSFESM